MEQEALTEFANPLGNIYSGFWINRSLGAVRGATLTLDRRSGGLLIAFIALFVGVAGHGFWKIARLVLHFALSDESNRDAIYHQRQVVLRNSTSYDTALAMVQASHAWRRRGRTTLQRTLPVALVATLLSAAFSVAGIFSSKITTSSVNEVLVAGKKCGPLPTISAFDIDPIGDNTVIVGIMNTVYLDYAMQCYPPADANLVAGCSTFIQPTLPHTMDTNASCPFADEICKSAEGNLALDSGLLDSYKHLGMNKGPRVLIRQKMNCAPLTTVGFSEVIFDNQTSTNWLLYKYGQLSKEIPYLKSVPVNVTMPYNEAGDYRVTSVTGSNEHVEGISLIPQLNVSNAETTILWLDSSTVFNKWKVEDPWFAATTPSHPSAQGYGAPAGEELYASDEPRGVVGCATSFQFCHPSAPDGTNCVDMISPARNENLERVWSNKDDLAYLRFLYFVLKPIDSGTLGSFFEIASLPAPTLRSFIRGNQQSIQVDSEMWKIEFWYYYQATLAAMQANTIAYAKGWWPSKAACPEDAPCERVCHSWKARSTAYYSFSVLGLSLILVVGGLIGVFSVFLEIIIDLAFKIPFIRNNKRLSFAYAEWQTGTPLQLQRLAHESIGLGTWSGATAAIPVTAAGDVLGVLDVSRDGHPRLIPPSSRVDDVIHVRPNKEANI
ncbi:hypothetical protein BKA66DRAFT_566504 [Pyrenochaeta sp. MPI-SDFR-AT-0127]|nr:hypothetical protein BKA66DRAFT_566504 [Pyrenochaeta sp. MPI-SDFR-AT-0127]